jgi:PTH1 family peptidyl-tRNA hydrolase
MILVAGLGNPGAEYARNRHNVGYMAADAIVRRHLFGPWRSKFQGSLAEGAIGGRKVFLLKPATFMNLSGQSVGEAARFLKIPVTDLIVLHDELDLEPGRLRVKRGGGAGGHNGLKSIDSHLGQDYRRVRIGIGHPGHRDRVTGYVLHDFAKAEETSWLGPMLDGIADAFPLLVAGQDNDFMNRVVTLTALPKPKRPPASAEPNGAPERPPKAE